MFIRIQHIDVNRLLFTINEWNRNSSLFKWISDDGQICMHYEFLIPTTDISKEIIEWTVNMITIAEALIKEFEIECVKEGLFKGIFT